MGKIDLVDFEENGLVDGHVSIIRIDTQKYNPLFLTYFLRSLLGAFQIERDFTGATNQIELYANEIANFEIPDISKEHQEAIVNKIKTELDKQKGIESQIAEKQAEISKIIEEAIKASEDTPSV